jgi:hypothetical protein
MSAHQISGSCLCGHVTYEVTAPDPLKVNLCYCSHCRKSSASLFDAYLIIPTPAFHIRKGREHLTTHSIKADSGADVMRTFCNLCGTRISGNSTNKRDMEMFDGKGATTVPIGPLDVPTEEINKWEKGEEWYTDQRIVMKMD